MTQITSQILEQISEIVRPFALTASDRQALLVKAFGADSRADRLIGSIDLSSATSNFTALLIRRLVDYGEFDPGQPALTVLLLTIRADVGSDKQSEIDTLLAGLYKNGEAPTLDARDHYAPPSGEHVFISYSRADKQAVLQFIADVEKRGVRVWVDESGLTPGTPDWEQALRDAIRGSRAVILAASPDSRRSAYVKDEIRIAQMYKRPIYPVWVNGDEWMDSIPMGLGGVQFVDVRGDTYVTGVAEIARSLAQVAPLGDQPEGEQTHTELVECDPVERNPYKGLQAFTADDTRYFFGRDKLVDELVAALDDTERFLPVIGASGSGKSSVVMAGLLPRLQAEHDDWTFLKRVVPGTHSLEALANTLAAAIPGSLGTVVLDSLTKDASNRSLHVLAAQISHTRVVLFVDQFEELFTVSDPLERDRFLELLMAAATEPNGPLLVIFTMRADFMDRPLGDTKLAELFQERSVFMKPMDVGDLRDVIVKPAALQGLTFDENLVGDLLFEVRGEVGALPLLEFALSQLYEARDSNRLTRTAYDDIGGVRGAIAAQAEATYLDLPSERHRRLARALFLRLIEPGATEQDTTRRRIGRNELTLANAEDTAIMQEVADAFTGARLLVSDEDTVEVAHEALIREWNRLKLWLNEARDDLRLQKKVNADAADWVRAGRPDNYGGFYAGTLLIDAQTWASHATPSQDEAAFIAASHTADEIRQQREETTARRVRNFRRASVVLGVMVVLALGATILAGVTALTARDESNAAQTAQAVANADRATATVSQGEALNEVNRAATQVAAAENTVAAAAVAQGLAIAAQQTTVARANIAATREAAADREAVTAVALLRQAEEANATAESAQREALRQRAESEMNFGRLAYERGAAGDLEAGRTAYQSAAALFEQLEDPDSQAGALYNLGLFLQTRESELPAARAAYDAALILYRERGDSRGEGNTLKALGDLARREDDLHEARVMYEDALTHFLAIGDRAGEAHTLIGVGDLALREADLPAARAAYEAALSAYQEVGDRQGEASTLLGLGELAQRESNLPDGRASYEAALIIFRETDDSFNEANTLSGLGDIALREADLPAARTAYESALRLYREIGGRLGEANALQGLGNVALRESDLPAARTAYELALRLYREIGERSGEANMLSSLGDVALRESDLPAARTAYEAALSLYREIGARLGEANTLLSLGDVALREDDLSAARTAYEAALSAYREIGDRLGEANALANLGDVALRESDLPAARTAYEAALSLYREIGARLGEANTLLSLGSMALREDDLSAALTAYEAALSVYQEIGDRLGEANALSNLGDVALREDDFSSAQSFYTQSLGLYEDIGDLVGILNTLNGQARTALGQGDVPLACKRYAELFTRAEGTVYEAAITPWRTSAQRLGCEP